MATRVRLTRRGRIVVFAVGALFSSSLLTYGASELAGAAVSVNEVYPIATSGPNAGTFTILGRGYGHGHGLSQYGAKGAAEKGLSTSQILSFYYPGTTPAQAGGSIRVLLSIPGDPLQVVPTASLTALDTGNGSSVALPTSLNGQPVKQWSMGTDSSGATVLYYLQNSWIAYRTFIGDGEFLDPQLGYVTLAAPWGKQYSGALLAASPVRGQRQRAVVNIVNLEDYTASVTPAEMPSSWPPSALAAQAVAARTYAVSSRASHAGSYYDICDTTWCQVYAGRSSQAASTNQAVANTSGVYLAYQGQPAFTQFSSSNAGWESDGGKPYLPSKADPYTPTPEQLYGRDYSWSSTVSASALQKAYPAIGTLRAITITGREGGAGAVWGGRVTSMTLSGSAGSVAISGDRFSAIYGLASTWVTIKAAPDPCLADSSGGTASNGRIAVGVGESVDCVQQVYLVNAAGHLMTRWQTGPGAGWTDWSDWGGGYTPGSSVGVGRSPDGVQQIYLVNPAGHLQTRWQTAPGGTWTGWTDWGGGYAPGSATGVGQGSDGSQQIYLVDVAGHLQTRWQTAPGGTWTGWSDWGGGYASGTPIGVGQSTGAQQIYLVNSAGRLLTKWQTAPGSVWTDWSDWGGGYAPGTPIGVGQSAGAQQIYWINGDGHLLTRWQTAPGGGWTTPRDWGGSYPSGAPVGVGVGAGAQQIYIVGSSDALLTQWQTAPGGGWTAMQNWGTGYSAP